MPVSHYDTDHKVFQDEVTRNIVELLKDKGIETPVIARKLYHYTNAAGFHGIVDSGSLHLGDALLMNDSEEINYAANLFLDTLTSMSGEIHNDERDILWIFFAKVRDAYGNKNPTTRFFVLCFSEDHDELSQWRGYGGGRNGFAIEFDFAKCNIKRDEIARVIPFKDDDNQRFIKVCYDDKIQLTLVKQLIRLFENFCKKLKEEHNYSPDLIASALEEVGHNVVMHCMLKFKHPAYHHEKEWRIVEMRGIGRKPGGGLSLNGVKFKVSNNAVVPYVVVKDLGEISRHIAHTTLITGVRIGPRDEIERFVNPTEYFLSSKNIIVDVKCSDVPLRY